MTGEAGRRRAWWGIWLVATAVTLRVIVGALELAVVEIHKVLGTRGLHATEITILGFTALGTTLALSIGLALHASGEPRGRRWAILAAACVVLAAAIHAVPWPLLVEDVFAVWRWTGWARAALWALGGLAFARALSLADGHSRTSLRLFATAVALHLAAVILVDLTAPDPFGHPMPGSGARTLLAALYYAQAFGWLYLAADRLGAFRSSERTPQAAVRSDLARATATACGIGLFLCGTGLLAIALWATRRVGVDVGDLEVASGIPLMVGGAAGLWRLRAGRVSLVALALGAVALVVTTRFVLASAEQPADEVELVEVQVPGLAISLPAGDIDEDYAYREAGTLRLGSRHLDIGLVELAWMGGEEDPHADIGRQLLHRTGDVTAFSTQGGPGRADALIWTLDNVAQLFARWRCPDDDRWFTLEISFYEPSPAQLRALGERVLSSTRCDPASLAAAPPIAIPYAPPAGYRPMSDVEPQTAAWQGPEEDVHSLIWSSEGDLALALTLEPESVLAAYQVAHLADKLDWLESIEVGEGTRKVGQLVTEDGTRYLVTAWRCYPTSVSVAAFHVGASSLPREPALAVFKSGGCPPPTPR